jgi:hypothetical protein
LIPQGAPGTTQGTADPYPSNIGVSGLTAPVEDVNATINNYSHNCPADVDILLVGPTGVRTVIYSDSGGSSSGCQPGVSGITITFDDEAAATYPCNTNPAGTFRPTDNACTGTGTEVDSFPAPAPSGPHPVSLSAFDGTDPNGTWSLYVFDDAMADVGNIGGWRLTFQTPDPAPEPEPPSEPLGGDVDAPNTTITKGPKDKTNKKEVTFEFTSTEPGSTFQCILDGKAEFKPCTSPFTVKVKRGKHTFQVQATDPAGNTDSTPATDDWKRKRKN